jgi:hypothetical protein
MSTLTVSAQLAEDRVPQERIIPLRDQVKAELENYPHRLGPFRLFPQFQLRNLGYNNNVFGTEDNEVGDWTATVAAGTRYLMPFGRKVFLRGDLMPEYTYYQELEDNRTFGGTYSASLLGLFNEMSVEVGADRNDRVQIVTSESETPARVIRDGAVAKVDVDVLPRISLFGSFIEREYEYDANTGDDIPLYDELERTDDALRAGIRYNVASFFSVSAAAEVTSSEFVVDPFERDNESNAVLLGVHYDRPRMFVNLSVGQREGEAKNAASTFPSYEETTGSWFASYKLGAPIELEGFGHRGITYGLFTSNPYFLETRNGAGIRFRAGERAIVRPYAEFGSNDYPTPVLFGGYEQIVRSDDVTTYGATMFFRLWRNAALEVNAAQTEYDSNIPGYGRSVLRVSTGLTFRRDLFQ